MTTFVSRRGQKRLQAGLSRSTGAWPFRRLHRKNAGTCYLIIDETQTQLAALVIHNADLPKGLKVTVLFDAYYLCAVVADACKARSWSSAALRCFDGAQHK